MRFASGPLLLCLAVVVAAGVVHGVQTDRWRVSAELEHALGRLPHIPPTVGDWKGEEVAHEPEVMARAGIKGWVSRKYQNAQSREAVSLLVVCGRGGPISVHTPDICYAGAGYHQLGDAKLKAVEVDGRRDEFWVARFGKPGVVPVQIEIYWAWSRDGQSWEAPKNPRLELARSPALYKMYVVRQFAPGSREEKIDSCEEFLRRALPELRAALAG